MITRKFGQVTAPFAFHCVRFQKSAHQLDKGSTHHGIHQMNVRCTSLEESKEHLKYGNHILQKFQICFGSLLLNRGQHCCYMAEVYTSGSSFRIFCEIFYKLQQNIPLLQKSGYCWTKTQPADFGVLLKLMYLNIKLILQFLVIVSHCCWMFEKGMYVQAHLIYING